MVDGATLKRERKAERLFMYEIAKEIGVSRQTLWSIERQAEVPPHYVESYRAAIARLKARII